MNASKWVLTVLTCGVVLAGLGFYKLAEIRAGIAAAEAFPEQSETVEVTKVTVANYRPELTVVGEVVAPQRLDLRNEIGGEIAAVSFASGASVSKGQTLIQLDDSVERANLKAAQARADLAKLVLDRNRQLFDSGVSNADQLDRANAELTTASAQIDVLTRTIDKMTLRAPFDGRAGLHTFEVGQVLPANTLITNLVGNTDDMWVDFQVPQFYRQLQPGAELSVTTIDDANDATPVSAVVIAENTILNANNRSRGYRARVPNRAARYSANTMVNVQVPTGEAQRVLSVPATAVQNDPLGQFVYLLEEGGSNGELRAKRQRVDVKVMENDRALLEPAAGLAEGDRIAAAGAFKLYEGILTIGAERANEASTDGSRP
jgi:membrane fusion protein (multidrug efflux system)